MRAAGRRLHISQPPLSRKIQRLEAELGIALFSRHSRGMELTENGKRVLEMIQPLLRVAGEVSLNLENMRHEGEPKYSIGLTTAFEQKVFAPLLTLWRDRSANPPVIIRKESPKLAKDILRGKIDAAFVALPLEAAALFVLELAWSEKLWAMIPASWPEAQSETLNLKTLDHKPLFWFKRQRNPAWFDMMLAVFKRYEFSPRLLEEPLEHDVLLARIAFGDGWALLPESFICLKREGVRFVPLAPANALYINPGFICANEKAFEKLKSFIPAEWIKHGAGVCHSSPQGELK